MTKREEALAKAAEMTEAELVTLVARLSQPFARNVRNCIEVLRQARSMPEGE